jgi:hypothetical protein
MVRSDGERLFIQAMAQAGFKVHAADAPERQGYAGQAGVP